MKVLVLPLSPLSVRQARQFVRVCCDEAGVLDDVCEVAVLLTSETVTNAFVHGRSEARLAITVRGSTVAVEVADDNSRLPHHVSEDSQALDGRGLRILAALASDWGVREEAVGKTVWFEVRG